MPLIKNRNAPEVVTAPREPHLALMVEGNESPEFMGIPKGSVIAIVTDPTDPNKGIFPLTPVSIGPKRLVFKCPCGQAACDRKVVFNGTWTGMHPHGTNQISVKK